jgi:type I restriction enzyme, R subunit
LLIRNIVGLDIQAARAAFAEFIERENLRPAQMQFLETIIRHLTTNGIIDKAMLWESPFTDVHDQGVFGVFEEAEVVRLISLIDGVNRNAVG